MLRLFIRVTMFQFASSSICITIYSQFLSQRLISFQLAIKSSLKLFSMLCLQCYRKNYQDQCNKQALTEQNEMKEKMKKERFEEMSMSDVH